MSYEVAMGKAWDGLARTNPPACFNLRFLADEYEIRLSDRTVISLSCNVPAKDFSAILILHYAAQRYKGLPVLDNQWQSFRELAGVEGYADAFRKRSIEPIIRKYGKNPQGIFDVFNRIPAKRINQADAAIIIDAFERVPALVELWAGDDEFAPEANMLFDKSITNIFCTEDIVVLAGLIAAAI